MNCDHVFDVLTRGPFPSGEPDDDLVLDHLERCPSCHRLAEALRPALEMFQEAVSVEESHDLPGFWGELSENPSEPAARGIAARIASLPSVGRLQAAPAPHWLRRTAALPLGRFVASTMIAAGAVLIIMASRPEGASESPPAAEPLFPISLATESSDAASLFAKSTPEVRRMLASILRPACYISPGGKAHTIALAGEKLSADMPDHHAVACCNDCHRRDSDLANRLAQAPPKLTMLVAQSCSVCHQL